LNYYIIPGLVEKKMRDTSVGMAIRQSNRDVIVNAVLSYFQISFDALMKRDRRSEKTFVRHMLCWLLRKKTQMTLVDIASMLGGRDHTTVIHSAKTFQDRLDTEPEAQAHLDNVLILIDRLNQNVQAA
jgi:chromosomal replication initiator protein